ncbi:MAG: inorganic phosphate transporter [Chitinophagaceae bacterium]|nr:inorganic phosphate transporter [Chitinophagaceae bacterium]
MSFVLIIIILALIFDYINGFHDAANSIATVVSTKVLTPFQAVLWAAFFNVVAFFIFKDHAVANTIGKTVFKDFITLPVIFSGLIAAIFWNLLTWWYGIPSSSSHTLIGGFAGAAITAAWMKDSSLDLAQIIDSGKVFKTVAFIFLAPLIGMLISMFFTLVMIQRLTWIKCGILALVGVGLWFLFQNFQEGKIKENLTKFYRIDKNSKIVSDETIKMKKLTEPEKIEECKKKIEEAQGKVTKAELALKKSQPFFHQYESKGADWVAEQIVANVDIKTTVTSRIGDKLNAFYKTEQLKVLSKRNETRKKEFEYAKATVDSLKPLAKKYYDVGYDSMIALMVTKANMNPLDAIKFKDKMKFDVTNDLSKEISKGDNKMLRYFILGGLLIFIISFIFVEKLREPSAGRQATLFKRLQLLSSAGFSIGHGGNDAQKVMGIIAAALMANGDILDIKDMPNWVPLSCYAAIGLGTLSGGWKIVKTMGTKITKVTPLEGVCAETAGATTLFLTEQMGIPVSTTHTITGSIIGVGATKRLSAVRWGVTINLLWAWILTIPVSALLAALTYWIYTLVN